MSITVDNSTDAASRPPFDTQVEVRAQPTIPPRQGDEPAQLSFAQERIWFLDQLTPGDALFNLSQGIRLKGALDVAAVERALTNVVARHEILRTTFAKSEHHANTDGRPRQLVNAPVPVKLELIEPAFKASVDREQQVRELARAEARKPFDLTLGPLFRPVLIRTDEAEQVLLLNTHRIVADEASLQEIFRELVRETAGIVRQAASRSRSTLATAGWQPAAHERQLQFADYSEWEREQLADEAAKECASWWRQMLAGAPAVLELPTDRPRPALQTSNGNSCELEFNELQTAHIRELSRNAAATVHDVVLTALQIVLARYSRQSEVMVGLATNNRPAGADNLVGPFADALVLRTDVAGKVTFNQLVTRVAAGVRDAREHGSIPFARLLDELNIERSLSHAPLFQVLVKSGTGVPLAGSGTGVPPVSLGLQEISESPDNMGETHMPIVEPFEFEAGIAAYDLTLHVKDASDHLKLHLNYNTDLFERSTAQRMLGRLVSILTKTNPALTIDSIDLLTAEETQTLRDWNRTAVAYESDSVIDLFERQVKATPAAEALVFDSESLTYEELNRRANQLAHHLSKLGIDRDARVGVCFERSVEMVLSVLAILKAGGAYVPLDPKYPAERLRFMLADSKCSAVLTSEMVWSGTGILPVGPDMGETPLPLQTERRGTGILPVGPDMGETPMPLPLDLLADTLKTESEENLARKTTADNLAYVIYTSGSTGWPKGVAMTQRALANLINWQDESPFLPRRTLQFASLSFDVSFQELFSTWCSGGSLFLIADAIRADAAAMLRFLVEHRIERLFLPFVYLQHLAEAAETHEIIPTHLREVITAGEQLEVTPQIARFFARLPDCRLHNHYGPSETHVVTAYELTGSVAGWPALPPIGRAIANTELHIVNSDLTLAPIGVPGELLIGGANLSRGYLDRPEITAERYVPNPFSDEPGSRLYRTGDLARYGGDVGGGNIDFLGRIDNQVKIRGFRIELGEIEAALRTHAAIRDVVVRPREKNDALVAYVVTDRAQLNGSQSLSGELRAHLHNRLPDYMVPAIFVELERLPLTPSGKIDRRALSLPNDYRPDTSQRIAPRDKIEEGLVQLWERVLGIKSIGVTDNFFELGGHSLLASRLFAQIENRFGRNLPLATLFQSPTIEQLATVLRERETRKAWSSLVEIQPLGTRPPLFCVHAAGANVLIYRPLARHLGLDQPVYALQAQGLDGRTPPFTRVEDIAAHYLKDIRALQPQGPYFLLGASFGGLVIYEMALQLLAQGQQVAMLAMLNTDCPVVSLGKRLRCHVGNLRQKGPKVYVLAALGSLLGRVNARAGAALETAAANSELKEAIESRPDLNDPLVQTVLANLEAEKNYVPASIDYPGKITYFWASDAESTFEDNRFAWARLAREGFELHKVPGDHGTMREEPHVRVLAEKLKLALD
jgi:amino acid adenylation domain-containing protein